MDALPDIDIDSGVRIDDYRFRGEISIQGVEFTYQMRPDNQVRRKQERIVASRLTPHTSHLTQHTSRKSIDRLRR